MDYSPQQLKTLLTGLNQAYSSWLGKLPPNDRMNYPTSLSESQVIEYLQDATPVSSENERTEQFFQSLRTQPQGSSINEVEDPKIENSKTDGIKDGASAPIPRARWHRNQSGWTQSR